MTKETKEPTREVEVSQKENSVEVFISQAIREKVPIETLERLLTMRDKIKAEQSKEAFILAMSKFQADCPVIEKQKSVMNKDGKSVRYKYAPLDVIVAQVKKPLGENGLSYTVDVVNEEKFITAVCKITHQLGHSEVSSFKVPIDTEGYMSAPQKYASALTFAKRYAFCNALGILTGDEDTDAGDTKKTKKMLPANPKAQILFLLKQLGFESKNKDAIFAEVKKRTGIEVTDNENDLVEIRNRLEVTVQEQNENRAI